MRKGYLFSKNTNTYQIQLTMFLKMDFHFVVAMKTCVMGQENLIDEVSRLLADLVRHKKHFLVIPKHKQ